MSKYREIMYNENIYAAKQIHASLLQSDNEGVDEINQKYQRECQLMAGLQHPNIIEFLGLCILEGSELPLLVMEKLEMSVDDLLVCSQNIPLPVKISILTDTSSGLVYLHSQTPPIVHRDLTARNVLLTASLIAKITDLGNSRMVRLRPDQTAQTLTKAPGTTAYMPPEALSESHRYGLPIDVFSFGHLALFTLSQMFPGELLSSTYPDPSNPDKLIARSEVDRRQTYMAILETTCGAFHPVLLDLVQQCLQNTPMRRPSSQDLLTRLRAVKSEIEGVYGGNVVKQLNTSSVLHVKEMKDKKKKIKKCQISELVAFIHQQNWKPDPDINLMMAYYITQFCQWNTLLPYSTRGFAMTTVNNKPFLLEEMAQEGSHIRELKKWQLQSSQLTFPFLSSLISEAKFLIFLMVVICIIALAL